MRAKGMQTANIFSEFCCLFQLTWKNCGKSGGTSFKIICRNFSKSEILPHFLIVVLFLLFWGKDVNNNDERCRHFCCSQSRDCDEDDDDKSKSFLDWDIFGERRNRKTINLLSEFNNKVDKYVFLAVSIWTINQPNEP